MVCRNGCFIFLGSSVIYFSEVRFVCYGTVKLCVTVTYVLRRLILSIFEMFILFGKISFIFLLLLCPRDFPFRHMRQQVSALIKLTQKLNNCTKRLKMRYLTSLTVDVGCLQAQSKNQ